MKRFAVLVLTALSASMLGQALGTWSEPNWPNGYYTRAIHFGLLPDERLFLWNNSYSFGQPLPNTPKVTLVSPGVNYAYTTLNVGGAENTTTNLFCVGYTLLEDGRLFTAGGHLIENGYGDDRINVFDYRDPNLEWITSTTRMTQYRWYPSVTYLPDRRILITTGLGGPTHAPSYIPDMWVVDVPFLDSPLRDYGSSLPEFNTMDTYYPFFFVDPKDGNLILANRGRNDESWHPNKKLDLVSMQWSNYATLPTQSINVRDQYPSAVFVNAKTEAGIREAIVLMSGGSKNGEQTLAASEALMTNLYGDPPVWTAVQPMNKTRQNHQLVVLPTGDIIAFGGSDRFGPNGTPILAEALDRITPELWNPLVSDRLTRQWKLLATPTRQIPRGYHSTALLLPDARIMTGGGEPEGGAVGSGFEFQRVSQIFSPPYGGREDWATRRPVLNSAPSVIRYGEPFTVTMTPNATSGRPITKLFMMSPAVMTHAYNQRQDAYELDFEHIGGNSYLVTPPDATKLALPGHYMLFAVDNTDDGTPGETRIKGIPSICKWVQLKDFELIFVHGGRLASGSSTGEIRWKEPVEFLIADNKYAGGALRYGPGLAGPTLDVEFEGEATTPNPTKVRFRIQARGNSNAMLTVFLKKRSTGIFTSVQSGLQVSSTEKDFVVTVDNADYVGANGEITARARFRQTGPALATPSIFIDVAEFGVR